MGIAHLFSLQSVGILWTGSVPCPAEKPLQRIFACPSVLPVAGQAPPPVLSEHAPAPL